MAGSRLSHWRSLPQHQPVDRCAGVAKFPFELRRWEIDFVDYGDEVQVEIERFVSDGHIDDEAALDELFAHFSDKEDPVTQNAVARK